MFKSVFVAVASVLLLGLGCSSPLSPNKTQPIAGIYYLPANSNYGQPQAYIWNGSNFRVGSVSQGILSVSNYSFEGDSIVNLTVINAGKSFSARSKRLPITINDYRVADSIHPFSGLYGTADNSYIFAIADSGQILGVVGYAKIIYSPAMTIIADGINVFDMNETMIISGRDWGKITRVNKTKLLWGSSGVLWAYPDSGIQLIGMDF
jgi:hypothetical protein